MPATWSCRFPNPAIINVTAQRLAAFFPDQATVATIEARAGRDGCGPRLVGLPDRTPGINETYSWSVVSGPGNFTGPTNLPQIPVSAFSQYPNHLQTNGNVQWTKLHRRCNRTSILLRLSNTNFVDAQYSCPVTHGQWRQCYTLCRQQH